MATFNICRWYPSCTYYGRFSGESDPVVVRSVEGFFDGDSTSQTWHCFTVDEENRSIISRFNLSNNPKEAVRLYYDAELTQPSPLSVPNVGTKRARVLENVEALALNALNQRTSPLISLQEIQVSS